MVQMYNRVRTDFQTFRIPLKVSRKPVKTARLLVAFSCYFENKTPNLAVDSVDLQLNHRIL